jgi:hypothetical protein
MIEPFEHKIERRDDGCWQWTGNVSVTGYGRLWTGPSGGRRLAYAHRYVYTVHRGLIPHGLTLDHLCRNTRCVNPEHLEPVTAAENTRRAGAAVTHCVRGHVYDEQNTYLAKKPGNGRRACRACHRENERNRRGQRAERRTAVCSDCGLEFRTDNLRRHSISKHGQKEAA